MTGSDGDTPPEELFDAAAAILHGFSERPRLIIIQHLLTGEHRVVDLQEHVGLAQSTVSKHLAYLLRAGLLTVRAEGRASVYALAHPEATRALLAATDRLVERAGLGIEGEALIS